MIQEKEEIKLRLESIAALFIIPNKVETTQTNIN